MLTPAVRVATYNIHKCRGMDGRVSVARIVAVLKEVNAHIVALQEVVDIESDSADLNQARFIANQLHMHLVHGKNRLWRGKAYGNVTLSRFNVFFSSNHDISITGYEPRGCLRADVVIAEQTLLHVFNVHLGTGHWERRGQGQRLVADDILFNPQLVAPRIVLGDFNEWTHGLASALLSRHLCSPDLRQHIKRRSTYPGVFPFLHLDHIYHDPELQLQTMTLHRSRTALMASDHLPLVAEFNIAAFAATRTAAR
jgi:endonuclease/exonuclease/phosphatase family metal-dependent hydrolase